MKKLFSLVLALAMILSCTAVFAEAEEEAEYLEGNYTLHNATGEKIVALSFTDNADNDVLEIINDETEPLEADETIALNLVVTAAEGGDHRLTISFTTESGYSGTFSTLSIESVAIDLLAVDATSGATTIRFTDMLQGGVYTIVNGTGGKVTNVSIAWNEDGSYISLPELEDGDSDIISFYIPSKADKDHCLTLSFVDEAGELHFFETLSIETVTITLRIPDATSGATPLVFSMDTK